MIEINETYRAVGRRLAQIDDERLRARLTEAARRHGDAEVNFAISFVGDTSLALDLLDRFYPVPLHKSGARVASTTATNHNLTSAVTLFGRTPKASGQAEAPLNGEAMPLRLNGVPIAGWAVWDRPEANPRSTETMTVRLLDPGRDETSAPRHHGRQEQDRPSATRRVEKQSQGWRGRAARLFGSVRLRGLLPRWRGGASAARA